MLLHLLSTFQHLRDHPCPVTESSYVLFALVEKDL